MRSGTTSSGLGQTVLSAGLVKLFRDWFLAIGGGPDTRYAPLSRTPYEPYNAASLGRKHPVSPGRTDRPPREKEENDARCDIEEPVGAVARALPPQRCSPVHGDGRHGRGGPDRGGRRPCDPHGGWPARRRRAEDRDCGRPCGARGGAD